MTNPHITRYQVGATGRPLHYAAAPSRNAVQVSRSKSAVPPGFRDAVVTARLIG